MMRYALQGVAYANDRQIAHIDLRKHIDARRPRVELELSPLP